MSCSSLTSCQHGHVRTLSSTDEHVFARLRVDPRSCMLCCSPDRCHTFYVSRMPSQCCVLSYKAVPFLHSARATPTVASLGPRLPRGLRGEPARAAGAAARGARAGAPCATRCGCPRAPGVGRTLGRGGGGEEGTGGGAAGRGRGAGGPATVASAETATPQSSSRLQTRASRHAAGPGYTPGATARSCVKARQKRHISTARKPSAPPRPHSALAAVGALVVVPRARE
jgi:hypothetical protein